MTKSLSIAGLALFFLMALFSAPAFAYDIDSFAYQDGPDSAAGGSYTDLDSDDWYEDGAFEASVWSTLYLGGTQLGYGEDDEWDDEWSDPGEPVEAVVSLSGSDGSGWYEVVGDYWEYTWWGWMYLGETDDWVYLPPPCDLPEQESTSYYDWNGFLGSQVATFRTNGYTPCGVTAMQDMYLVCPVDSSEDYLWRNPIELVVTDTAVSAEHSGVGGVLKSY